MQELADTNTNHPSFETKREFAQRHRVSMRTLDNWIQNKLIPVRRFSKRCIRIPVYEAEAALEKFQVHAVTKGGK